MYNILHNMFTCTLMQYIQMYMYIFTLCSHVHSMFTGTLIQHVHMHVDMYRMLTCEGSLQDSQLTRYTLIHKHLCLLLVHGDHSLFTHLPSLSFNMSGFLGAHSTTTLYLPCIQQHYRNKSHVTNTSNTHSYHPNKYLH